MERRLGAGAYGAVWLAHDSRLERAVAVKIVPRAGRADGPGAGRRAEREARAAARLNHPGIVALYEAAADEQAHYLVSELVEGVTLAEAEAQGALSDRDVLRIGVALCDALEHAHAAGVVHRDIKPGNVIVPAQPQSEAGVAKLTDFGVAHLGGEAALTHTGDVVGTLAYMAPEQAEGRRVGPEADLYALALVLYEALAGFNPVRAAAPAATARRVAAGVPSLARVRRDLDPELVEAIDRALRRRPDERGGLEDLRDALQAGVPAADAGDGRAVVLPEPPPAQPRRRTWHVRVAERLIAGAAAGAAAAAALGALSPPPPRAGAIALGVAVAVALLPRVSWLLAVAGGLAWLAAGPPHEPGTALVAAAGLVACPLLLPRAGWLWSLPAAAPALAASGLAGIWPALSGLAPGPARRAALGALGAWWIVLADSLTAGHRPWADSAGEAARAVLWPALSSEAVAVAALWALAAAGLPYLLRGRTVPAVVSGAALWAAALLAGTAILADLLPGATASIEARGAIAGAIAGAALTAGWSLLRAPRGDTPFP